MRKKFTNRIIQSIGTAALIFCLTACGKKANDEKIIDVEKEFNVQMWEKLDGYGGSLQFVVSTIKNQPCGNTRIEMNSNQIDSKLTMTIKSLIQPATCNNVSQPAVDTLTVGNVSTGSYNININLKDVVLNNGTLTVKDNIYKLYLAKQDGITLITPELLRVPSGTIWGYVSFDTGQDAKLLKFFDNLNKIANPITIPSGNYGYFNISSTKVDIKANFDTKKQNIRQIFHNLTKSTIELENLINEYRSQGLDIKMLTYDGKVF